MMRFSVAGNDDKIYEKSRLIMTPVAVPQTRLFLTRKKAPCCLQAGERASGKSLANAICVYKVAAQEGRAQACAPDASLL